MQKFTMNLLLDIIPTRLPNQVQDHHHIQFLHMIQSLLYLCLIQALDLSHLSQKEITATVLVRVTVQALQVAWSSCIFFFLLEFSA